MPIGTFWPSQSYNLTITHYQFIKQIGFHIKIPKTPYWWSSGLHCCLLLQRSEFESRSFFGKAAP